MDQSKLLEWHESFENVSIKNMRVVDGSGVEDEAAAALWKAIIDRSENDNASKFVSSCWLTADQEQDARQAFSEALMEQKNGSGSKEESKDHHNEDITLSGGRRGGARVRITTMQGQTDDRRNTPWIHHVLWVLHWHAK